MWTYLNQLSRRIRNSHKQTSPRHTSFRPSLENLEQRLVLDTYGVTGTSSADRFTIAYNHDDNGSWYTVKREAEYLRSGGFVNAFAAPRGAGLIIEGFGGDDVIELHLPVTVPEGMDVIVQGGSGNDSVQGFGGDFEYARGSWRITGGVEAILNGYTRLFDVEALIGQSAMNYGDPDLFEVAPGVNFNGRIDGGGVPGVSLSYQEWTTGVEIDLRASQGKATGVAGGIKGIDHAIGGAGSDTLYGTARKNILRGNGGNDVIHAGGENDVVLGGSGDDKLYGGPGHDLIIGGIGADDLHGLDGNDILIGGSTSYDLDDETLLAIVNQWSPGAPSVYGPVVDYSVDVSNLRSKLDSTTVRADTGAKGSANNTDNLYGGAGLDWFWADPALVQKSAWGTTVIKGDNVWDLQSGEVIR
jgi:Ca2+-binding RTX toxin-like protein